MWHASLWCRRASSTSQEVIRRTLEKQIHQGTLWGNRPNENRPQQSVIECSRVRQHVYKVGPDETNPDRPGNADRDQMRQEMTERNRPSQTACTNLHEPAQTCINRDRTWQNMTGRSRQWQATCTDLHKPAQTCTDLCKSCQDATDRDRPHAQTCADHDRWMIIT